MVGFNPSSEVQLSHRQHVIAGAVSGAATRALCQPLDVIKIRFQLQLEPIKQLPQSKYSSIPQAFRQIVKEETIRALWKGHVPAQYLSILYGIVQFGTFEILTKRLWSHLPEDFRATFKPVTHTLCGCVSGCLATFVVHPFDVLRTRLVAQSEPKVYQGLWHGIRTIIQREGFTGFYRGLSPALIIIGPQIGLQFGLYSSLTSLWNTFNGQLEGDLPGPVESFICGSGSGVGAKLAVYPLDVIKKRLQVLGFEQARHKFGQVGHYSGLLQCMREIFKQERLAGLYKGLSASLLKAAITTGLSFCFYEQVCHFYVLLRHVNFDDR